MLVLLCWVLTAMAALLYFDGIYVFMMVGLVGFYTHKLSCMFENNRNV